MTHIQTNWPLRPVSCMRRAAIPAVGKQQRKAHKRAKKAMGDDAIEDNGDDVDADANQNEVPELGPAHAPIEIHVVVLDSVHEVLPQLVEVHIVLPARQRPRSGYGSATLLAMAGCQSRKTRNQHSG